MKPTEHLLSTLAEECCEVGQRVSKALRFGMDEIQPGQPLTNRERIVQELNDLYAVAEMLGLDQRDCGAMEAKREKVAKFMQYAHKVGALDSQFAASSEVSKEA